jgi:hypothetical protein
MWKEGYRSGEGTLTSENGQVMKGKWINGDFV